ncbi:hypothetical protein [Spirosoma utsteinense]|uniref:Uncharacterized protein n=1 Tax=Spirosoma utsteinense TaxID=2585773 RepID=A0ABR6W276_9BACT|nr:hypothetical protein [Spirosoma utsteinense]MBC3785131.1 hypothetical protein [Spirosoma utsteinense]MBC3790258.1 hypothetical protein [Spirosoma utsteinense]
MARPTPELIEALRRTAIKLKNGAPYQWGHMGGCNCGNLAQELTKLNRDQIHQYAMQRYGDWNEQVEDYCSTSQMPIDIVINEMLNAGLMLEDLKHLEKLDDRQVLARFPLEARYLKHNVRDDVVAYMNAWAELLKEQLLEKITLPNFQSMVYA